MKKCITLFALILLHVSVFSDVFNFESKDIIKTLESNGSETTTVSHNSLWVSGYSLLETFPLMEEVYSVTISTSDKSITLKDDNLGENWATNLFLMTGKYIDLIFDGILYKQIKSISFKGTPMESDSLEIWLSWEGIDELKSEIEYFANLHHINIKATEVPNPESKLTSVVRARGDVPDLVMLQSDGLEQLVQNRAIQSLNYMDTTGVTDQGLEAFTIDKTLWALPFYFDSQVIFYNRSLYPEIKVEDWTLEKMESLAKTIKDPDIHPLAWNAYSSNWLIPFQISFEKRKLINSDGTVSVYTEGTVKALNYVLSLIEKDLLSPMERNAMDALFISGKAGMIMGGSYSIPYFESLGIDFGVLPYPINEKTNMPLSPLLDFKALCITKKTKSPLLARRLLQYLTGPGVEQRFCPELAKLPGRSGILDNPELTYGYLETLKNTVDVGTVIPPNQIYKIYKNNMWKLLRFALSGQMTVEDTLKKGDELMNNL